MTDYSHHQFLDVSVRDKIAFVTIGNARRLGACSLAEHKEFSTVLREIAADDDVNVAVLTGSGRGFSVGGDMDLLQELTDQTGDASEKLLDDARDLVLAHVDCDKPIIAAVNGYAFGSGAAFALLSDFIVMERQAVLADGHVRAALAAGDGGALIWPLTVGLTRAKKYLLTGDGIDAVEAERIGLISEVAEEGESLARATAIARRLADGPQRAIRYTKRSLNASLRIGVATAFDNSLLLEARTMGLPEAAQAISDLSKHKRPAIAPE